MEVKIEEFLFNFLKKELIVKDGRKKVPVKVYECPKCLVKGRTNGTFTNPINFVAYIIQDCPDFTEYLSEAVALFVNGIEMGSYLKSLMREIQSLPTQ